LREVSVRFSPRIGGYSRIFRDAPAWLVPGVHAAALRTPPEACTPFRLGGVNFRVGAGDRRTLTRNFVEAL
jgi:hypothetical protein